MPGFGGVEGFADDREGFLVEWTGIKAVEDQENKFLGESVEEIGQVIVGGPELLQGWRIAGWIRGDESID